MKIITDIEDIYSNNIELDVNIVNDSKIHIRSCDSNDVIYGSIVFKSIPYELIEKIMAKYENIYLVRAYLHCNTNRADFINDLLKLEELIKELNELYIEWKDKK